MIISINTTDSRPIYLQIMDEIRRSIVVGTTSAHEALPSVRQLSGELRVNPNTVQQAYRELERESVVYVKRGLGTFVSEKTSNGSERRRLALAVAERALRDTYRNGLNKDELIAAILEVASDSEGVPKENDE